MDASLYSLLLSVPAVILSLAFVLMSYRILQGPNSLDRVLGIDGFVATSMCALAVYICWSLDTTISNAMLVIALLGFISSLSVARFRKRDAS